MDIISVVQGDLSTTLKPRPSVLGETDTIDTNWACQLRVIDSAGNTIIDRTITEKTPDDLRFLVYLTQAETNTLPVETYTLVVSLSNSSTNPAFNIEQSYTLAVEPQYDPGTESAQLIIERGVNSFATYEELLTTLKTMPDLYAANNTVRPLLKAIFVQSWFDIGALAVDFENAINTTRYFDTSQLDALSATERSNLVRAQLQQTDFILSSHPGDRNATVRRLTVGDSTTVFRNNRAVTVCAEATRTLQPYLVPAQNHTAVIHP